VNDKNSASKDNHDNQDQSIKLMRPIQIALLQIISEGPTYGTQILDILKQRGYENWVSMKKSNAYKNLGILENENYIIGKREEDRITSKKVYSLTPKGCEKLVEQVKLCITDAPPVKSMFDLGLSGLCSLTKSEAISVLEQYKFGQGFAIKMFEDILHDLDNKDKLVDIFPDKEVAGNTIQGHVDNKGVTFIVRALFDRPNRIIKAQLKWLEEFIQSIKDDKGDFYFEGGKKHDK